MPGVLSEGDQPCNHPGSAAANFEGFVKLACLFPLKIVGLDMMAHTFNFSIQRAKVGRSLSFDTSVLYIVSSKPARAAK